MSFLSFDEFYFLDFFGYKSNECLGEENDGFAGALDC
jgi:hypothetical protein